MLKKLTSLKYKLLVVILPCAVLALAFASSLALYQAERQFEKRLEQEKSSLANYADLIVDPLWNFNIKRVENILETMMLNPDLIKVEVLDEGMNLVTARQKPQEQKNPIALEFPLSYSNAHITQRAGTLKIKLGDQSLKLERQQYLIVSAVTLFMIIFTLSVGTWIAFSHLFDKPIRSLLIAIKQSHDDASFYRVNYHSNDELGVISTAFNAMQNQLEQNHQFLNHSRDHLNNLYHATPSLLFSFDREGTIQDASDYFVEQLGFEKKSLIGSNLSDLLQNKEDMQQLNLALEQLWHSMKLTDIALNIVDGRGNPIEIAMDATLSAQNSFPGALAVMSDVTGLNQARRTLEHQANTDHLSGIANRFHFQQHLSQLINDRRSGGSPFALLFIDLDHFKSVNDTFGHHIGDQLICMATERIGSSIRPDDLIARLGGDEFAVILKHMETAEEAELIAKRILDNLKSSFSLADSNIFISASIGIALYPKDGSNPERLLQCADLSMYRAKEEGRSCYAFYSDEHNLQVQQRLKIEKLLRDAIKEDLLEVHYQPITCLKGKKITGIEALLRLRDKDTGEMISPVEFIPIAEESGLIIQIGEWCFAQSCKQLAKLQQQFDQTLYLSVNVSTRQFQSQSFISSIETATKEAGIKPESILLEITESLLLLDNENNLKIFSALQENGYKIAIDDFGTGYSALSYLMKFPLNVLKIDRSFINHLTDDEGNDDLVNAIVQMAHSMHLRVIAEGVETAEQLQKLRSISEDLCIQGFYYSRPLPPEKLTEQYPQLTAKAQQVI